MQQPLLTEETDVDVDPIQSAEDADRVCSILQNARRLHDVRWMKELCERTGVDVIVQLLVVEPTAGKRFATPSLRNGHARGKPVYRIHRPRIIDVVGGDERSVEGARAGGVEELNGEAAEIRLPGEDAFDPEILCAYV